MKVRLALFTCMAAAAILALAGCREAPCPAAALPATDTLRRHDTVYVREGADWQQGFGLSHDPGKDSVWNRPVSYYLDDRNCSGLAQDFYYGLLRPSDNGTTTELLALACTDNGKLRPFYRWCLTLTNKISDGALSEMTGRPSRKYAEKFPEEFFSYMDADTSGGRYYLWTGEIQYSGQYDEEDDRRPAAIRTAMIVAMKRRCRRLTPELDRKIIRFATDCFGDNSGKKLR